MENEKFDSMGYIEEDSDDHKENIDETFFNSDFNKIIPDAIRDENILENDNNNNRNFNRNYLSRENFSSINSFNLPRTSRQQSLQFNIKNLDNIVNNNNEKYIKVEERYMIQSKMELEELFKGNYNNNITVKYTNLTEEVFFNDPNNNNNIEGEGNEGKSKIIVIKSGQFLIILRYIYDAFHPFLIDLSDQLLIERLKYFEKDNEIYISIIKQYLGIKDRTFNFILEDLISKLNLTEDLIDASFSFYISSTDKTNKEIIEINEAYDDLIHADYK